MNSTTLATILCLVAMLPLSAAEPGDSTMNKQARILFLHHSTGGCIWNGGVPGWFADYNTKHGTAYQISEQAFPKGAPYGWKNYPFDYWNIWVEHAGDKPFTDEPTLEMLSRQYDVIIFKHCFPVSSIQADAKASPEAKTLANYKQQYAALKAKMRAFPKVSFIVWTPAALVQSATNEAEAKRTAEFSGWVKDTWDEKGDNVFVWDFHALETGGGLYLKPENAASPGDSHPNDAFSRKVAPLFAQRIVDVIEGRGDKPR